MGDLPEWVCFCQLSSHVKSCSVRTITTICVSLSVCTVCIWRSVDASLCLFDCRKEQEREFKMYKEVLFIYPCQLPSFLTLPSGWAGYYTCPALRLHVSVRISPTTTPRWQTSVGNPCQLFTFVSVLVM